MNAARLVQSIGWMAFLGLLLIGGGYSSYIASWQQWVLITATALFGGLVLIDAVVNRGGDHHDHDHHDHDHGTATDQWVQTLVHLLPLFLAVTLGGATLGSQQITSLHRPSAFTEHTSRFTPAPAPPATAPTTPLATADAPGQTVPRDPAPADPTSNAPVFVLDGPTPADPTTVIPETRPAVATAVPLPLLELYFPKKHPGVTRIETIGRVMIPTDAEKAKVPAEIDRSDLTLLVYRYVMTCCAADASAVFVVLRNHQPGDLKVDDWVQVTGTWIPAPGLGDMAKIEVDSLIVIEQPKEPFLQAPKD